MKTWKAIDTNEAVYVGIIEFQSEDGEWRTFEILKTDEYLVFGGSCNTGFLESGNMKIDTCFSLDENLQELTSDLETYYNDGKDYVSVIITNDRM